MDPGSEGIQHGTGNNAHLHADDVTTTSSNTTGSARRIVHVTPNLEDLPEKRQIEYWAVIQLPAGTDYTGEVTASVYGPDSSLKSQLTLQRTDCAILGDRNAAGTPIEAAFHMELVTASEADAAVAGCLGKTKAVYRAIGDISIDDPPGDYQVEGRAKGRSGPASVRSSYFSTPPVVGLKIDFDKVDFGIVQPNSRKSVTGDFVFRPPRDSRPTIKSVGNTPIQLSLKFDGMVGVNSGKTIEEFDAELSLGSRVNPGRGPSGSADDPDGAEPPSAPAEEIGAISAGTTVTFKTAVGVRMLGKLGLSVRPGAVPSDTYNGKLSLWGSR